MEKLSFEKYMTDRYDDQLGYYNDSALKNQTKYNYFQWTVIVLSTLTTIMAALPDEFGKLKYVMVVTSGLVTILTAALKTFKYEELWVSYRKTAEKLKPERFFFHFNIGKYGKEGVNKETVFVEAIEEILNKEQAAWLGARKTGDQDRLEMLEELQAKLDGAVREKFKNPKPKPAEAEEEPEATETNETESANGGTVPSNEEIKKILSNEKAEEIEEAGETGEPGSAEIDNETPADEDDETDTKDIASNKP